MGEFTYYNNDPGDEQPDLAREQHGYHQRVVLLNSRILEAARAYRGESAIQLRDGSYTIELPTTHDLIDLVELQQEASRYQLDFATIPESEGLVVVLKFNPLSLRWLDAAPPPAMNYDFEEDDEIKFAKRINAFCELNLLDVLRLPRRERLD